MTVRNQQITSEYFPSGDELIADLEASQREAESNKGKRNRAHYHFVFENGVLVGVKRSKIVAESEQLSNIDFTFTIDGKDAGVNVSDNSVMD